MADKLSTEEEYKIIREGAVDTVSYDAKLSEANNWLISIAISVFSPFVTDAIRDFVDHCKTEIYKKHKYDYIFQYPLRVRQRTRK